MSRKRSWISKAVFWAAIAAVGAAAVTTLDSPGRPVTPTRLGEPSTTQAIRNLGMEPEETAVVHAVELVQEEDLFEPAAICRLMPECSTNSDCDAKCGIGRGQCLHSKCPVRVCRCR